MLLPSALINFLATRYLPVGEVRSVLNSPLEMFLAITFYPLVETYAMRLGLFLLRKVVTNTVGVCVISAIGWGLLHFVRYWGLYVLWPFFVMSYCYLRLEKNSIPQAMVGSVLIHGGANAFATALSFVCSYFLS
jgi:hypothetical protein